MHTTLVLNAGYEPLAVVSFKRALVLAAWLGTAPQHRRRYAALTLQPENSHG